MSLDRIVFFVTKHFGPLFLVFFGSYSAQPQLKHTSIKTSTVNVLSYSLLLSVGPQAQYWIIYVVKHLYAATVYKHTSGGKNRHFQVQVQGDLGKMTRSHSIKATQGKNFHLQFKTANENSHIYFRV